MKTLRAAQHLDLALPSMTEVYPRYQRPFPFMLVYSQKLSAQKRAPYGVSALLQVYVHCPAKICFFSLHFVCTAVIKYGLNWKQFAQLKAVCTTHAAYATHKTYRTQFNS